MALNYCCFCAPLRTGTLVVAVLYLVVNCAMLLGWLITTVIAACYDSRAAVVFSVILGILMGICGANIAVDSLLVHGVRRHRRKFMLPWVVWYAIFKSAATIAWLYAVGFLSVGIATHPRDREGVGIGIAFLCITVPVGVVLLSVVWYWYACVVSYYIQLAPSDHYVMEQLRPPKMTDEAPRSPDESSDARADLVAA